MEVEDGVVGVREVMGEVGTGEVVAADGRAGEKCHKATMESLLKCINILGEVATTVVEVVVDMVVAVVMTEEVVEEVVAHKVQRTGANRLLGGALKSTLLGLLFCCIVASNFDILISGMSAWKRNSLERRAMLGLRASILTGLFQRHQFVFQCTAC